MLHSITIFTTLLLFAGDAPATPVPPPAGGLDLRQVPASAEWVGHFDVAAFLCSGLGAHVLEQMEVPDKKAGLDVLRNLSGIDLTRDIHSITVFGVGSGEDDNLALIAGRFERDKIMALLRTNPTLQEREIGGRQLYEWTDKAKTETPGPQRFGMFYRDDLILVGGSVSLLQQTVAVLDGEGAGLDANDPRWQVTPSTYLGLYLSKLPTVRADGSQAVVLEKIKSARIEIGELDGQQFMHTTLHTVDVRTANNLQRMAQGMVALMDLARDIRQDGRPALPAVAKAILADIEISTSDTMVQASLSTPVANVVEALTWMAAQQERQERR